MMMENWLKDWNALLTAPFKQQSFMFDETHPFVEYADKTTDNILTMWRLVNPFFNPSTAQHPPYVREDLEEHNCDRRLLDAHSK